jgi:hypothetical protein
MTPHCRVILTVYEMKRRDSAELTALADHLTAYGITLEMLAGPLPGIYDPTGTRDPQFATPRSGDHRVICPRPRQRRSALPG